MMQRARLFQRLTKALVFVFVFLLLSLVVAGASGSEVAASASDSEGKALSFLGDVMGLDMSKYTATVARSSEPSAGAEYITYHLDGSFDSQVGVSFRFFEGKLGYCNLSPDWGSGLLFAQPDLDTYNRTLAMLDGYGRWLNDSQVGEMANMLRNVGSQRNATEFSGNLTLKIVVYTPSHIVYKFSNTFNDVDYTGLSLTFGSGSAIYFDDSRAYKTIGDTSINISKDEAITIAENYVRNNTYVHNFGNGTKLTVSNLNVTGVGTVRLGSHIFNPNGNITTVNSTLSPYWYVQVNVSNLPAPGLIGVAVQVSANDGTVVSPILVGKPFDIMKFFPQPNPFASIYIAEILSIIAIFAGAIFVIIGVLMLVSKRKHEKEANPKNPNNN